MLTLAIENPDAASGNIFNLVSDRAVTLDGMARLCAQAAGRPLEIVHFDPKAVGVDARKAFPFRNMVRAFLHSRLTNYYDSFSDIVRNYGHLIRPGFSKLDKIKLSFHALARFVKTSLALTGYLLDHK